VDKCSAPQLKKNLRGKHRYNKKQKPSFCRCNFSIVILSLILSGLLLRGTYLFVDPLNMFHMVPSSLKSLFLNCGTSCWLSSAIITIECFVRSTQLALKLRVSVKDERRLRCASVSGTAALMVYGVTNLVVRYMDGFDQVYGFMNDYRVMIDGLCCLALMILAMYHGHQAVLHLGDNQRLFKSSPRNTQTPSTQHKRTTSTPARRTRRQQIVSTWIVHLRCLLLFILLLFLTIISYSLLKNGSSSALSYYLHNLLLRATEMCSLFSIIRIAEGSELSKWFSFLGWVRLCHQVEGAAIQVKKVVSIGGGRAVGGGGGGGGGRGRGGRGANGREAAQNDGSGGSGGGSKTEEKEGTAGARDTHGTSTRSSSVDRMSSKFSNIFVRQTSLPQDAEEEKRNGESELSGEEKERDVIWTTPVLKEEQRNGNEEWIEYVDEASGESYYHSTSGGGRSTWTNPKKNVELTQRKDQQPSVGLYVDDSTKNPMR